MSKAKETKVKVSFTFSDPNARSVLVAGDFTGWEQAPVALKKDKKGVWKKTLSLPPGCYEYRLLVDGTWCDDPSCAQRRPNQFGSENCLCVVQAATEPAIA